MCDPRSVLKLSVIAQGNAAGIGRGRSQPSTGRRARQTAGTGVAARERRRNQLFPVELSGAL
ncbi:hypothetical protein, partial [Staphylococcus aureus]|uniref:hypothetical protein n=1 Tax=Staphylococcus aureus TaxID=1280 RepID=UPI001F32D0A6